MKIGDKMNITQIYELYKKQPEKEVYICFTNKKEGKLLGIEIFENTLTKDFKYFFISEIECENSARIVLKDLVKKLKPKVFKTKYGKYKNNIILKLTFDERKETLEKIIKKIIYFSPLIKISKSENVYYLLIEQFNNFSNLVLYLENLKKKDNKLNYEFYKECNFKKKNLSRIFVEEGYFVYNYEFIFDQDIMIIESNNKVIDNIIFEPLDSFMHFDFSEKPVFEKLTDEFLNLTLSIDLIKRKFYKGNYRELKNMKRDLERELRTIDRVLKKIESNSEYMGGFVIEESKLDKIYQLLLLYDTEESDKIRVYLFKNDDKYYYFFYGPEYLIPNSIPYKYSEDPNYSTDKLKVLVPYNYQLIPELNLSRNEKLYKKFLNSIVTEDINVEDYILILDFKNKFFDKYGVFINKSSGITIDEFIEKYIKFENPENFELHIKDFNIKEKTKYEMEMDKRLEVFYNSIVEDIDKEISKALEKWDSSKKTIMKILEEEEAKLELFLKDVKLLKEKIEGYFENPSVLELLNEIIRNINEYNVNIKKIAESSEIKELCNNEYRTTKKMFEDTLSLLENIKKNMEEEKKKYSENFENISSDLETLLGSLNKIIDDYKNFDEKFSGVGGNNEEV